MKLFKVFIWTSISFLQLGWVLGVTGCAQKTMEDKTLRITPISNDGSHLIRIRLNAGEAPRPYDQIELGSRLGLREYKLGRLQASSLSWFDSAEEKLHNSPSHTESAVSILTGLIQTIHQASSEYFKTYPSDQQTYTKIRSRISADRCFDDGTDSFCGPEILSGALFLTDSESWKTLHHWLTAIETSMGSTGTEEMTSAAFQDFVRYFDFGVFLPFMNSSKLLTESNCAQAMQSMKSPTSSGNLEESDPSLEMNPCKLLQAHKKKLKPRRI